MSESAQPLSRRERREMEEAARQAEGDATQALPVAPESMSVASRRERRRMERLAHPVETWTAEEEMIATGQMPAMTPDVIAEQEQIAREKAAAEQAAALAYAETAREVAAQAAPVVDQAPAPEPAPEPEPETEPEPPSAVNEIPADLRHLFPPGSLQARAFAAQQPVAAEPAHDDPAHNDPADEIRRLTQEAMAGIARANTDATPVVAGTEFEPVEFTAPEPAADAAVPELPEGVDVEALWNAPTVDEPVRASIFPDSDAEATAPAPNDDLAHAPSVHEVPSVNGPHGQEGGAESAPVWSALVPSISATQPAPAQPAPAQAAPVQPAAQLAAQSSVQQAPSMWDTHPLTHPGATPVRELPAEPVQQSLPRPDLTALLGTAPSTGVGQATYQPAELGTSTTTIPQRLAEPHPGGGARHFRWAHLAVIGATAFLLGVVAWNIATRSGS